jgi:fumarylacetoacetate (FAA) hydrolase family protein
MLERLRGLGIESAYLEVGLGPYAEVFTKAPVLGAVGTGEQIHVRDDSAWSNPEPEIVLVVAPSGAIVGVTLGNDVNLRDLEGRSPLLLGIAKDNTASAAVGPWIRLIDQHFKLETVLTSTVTMTITGLDGFQTTGACRMDQISRRPEDLVVHASGRFHDYPDGFVLFLGTMVVPSGGRLAPGMGFTHHPGDVVAISNPYLGTLVNEVATTHEIPHHMAGLGALMENLAARGLLGRSTGRDTQQAEATAGAIAS